MTKEQKEFLKNIAVNFQIEGNIIDVVELNQGNINSTFIIICEQNGQVKKYVFQKISTNAFKEPYKLMQMIEKITRFIKEKKEEENDPRQTLEVIKTLEGSPIFANRTGSEVTYWRVYNHIENAKTFDYAENPTIAYNVGKCFGNFQRLLSSFPIDELEETIPDFHNTEKRRLTFMDSVINDPVNRAQNCYKEIVEIIQRSKICNTLNQLVELGLIPIRPNHNDTKVNNAMLDSESLEYITAIDLDTVMPGVLSDYADGVRSNASSADESETDETKIYLDLNLFTSFTEGFLSEMASTSTEVEIEYMAESIRIITLELAMRFLTDYLNGDTYFKINPTRPHHNLERARNQLCLVKDIEKKLPLMKKIIKEIYADAKLPAKCIRKTFPN